MGRTPRIFLFATLLAVVLATAAFAGEDEALAPPISCGNGLVGGVNCLVTKQDLKRARTAYERGVKLHNAKNLEEALAQFEEAAQMNPQNVQFLTAREAVKANLVYAHVERGNQLLLEDARSQAAAEFRAALNLDADNQFAREQLQEATREISPGATPQHALDDLAASQEIHLQPGDARATLHFDGDVRDLFKQLAAAYQMNLHLDDSVTARQVLFNVDDVDFLTALKLACEVSKSMWVALDRRELLIASDTPENHKQLDRMVLRMFVLPVQSSPQESTELVNVMRTMFDLRFVSAAPASGKVEVRGPQQAVESCAKLLAQMTSERPQVMLDVRVFQISHQLTRNMGLHVPDTFNLYNIPAIALAGLGGQNIQQLINQLVASGGINQAGSSSLSALLAQLQGQQNSIFSQPLATFGGGLTFSGLSLDQLAAQLSANESWVRTLEDLSLRTGQGTDATFHLGERIPILNASYAPIYNSPQISQVLGNQSYVPPFPSVSYEDIGLNMKAKPTVHGDGSVSLQLELQVRSLTGQSNNGVPVISNKEYKGSITLSDGEPAVVAGELSRSDTISMSGLPGLGFVPGLNMAMVTNSKNEEDDELMIVITPHVLSNFERSSADIYVAN